MAFELMKTDQTFKANQTFLKGCWWFFGEYELDW
jgi:hypothetical protein